MTGLSHEQIETINAYGPYNHSVWTYGELRITNEERLAGRVDLLAARIRESILHDFSMDEIRKMSIADIGCYDGWILQQLSDLPFAEIVGIEPRAGNITKAKKIREVLGIKSKIKFEIGDIDSLAGRKFDIVICTGVLHHLESISSAIRQLRSVCGRMLFLETICLSSRHISKSVKKEMELKDIAYFNREKVCGLTGQKYESAYYDGSANRLSVVSIPSLESLLMYLESSGFTGVETIVDAAAYSAIWRKKGRTANAVAVCARAGNAANVLAADEASLIADYETGLMETVLDKRFIGPLYERFHLGKAGLLGGAALNAYLYLRAPNWAAGLWWRPLAARFKERFPREIVKNLRFNPDHKLCLEYAKILFRERDYHGAIPVLKGITQKLNADWRSVYRSFYLLGRIYHEIGAEEESRRYYALCLTCNSKYPMRSGKDEINATK